jgi:hypothetical protein
MKNLRIKEKKEKVVTHPDFEVVPRGHEDVMIVTWGGKSGTVYTNPSDYEQYEDYHIFLKAYGDKVIQRLKDLEPTLRDGANDFTRARNCYLADVVDAYVEAHGRPEII